jgi:hypothetical protein
MQEASSGGGMVTRLPRRRLYRAGAISLIVAGVLVLITLPLIPLLIPSLAPASVQAGLLSLQSQELLYAATWGLYLVSDILYLIAFPALFDALKAANRAVMLIAVILNTAFVAIDVGLDIPLRLSLIGLSNSYVSAVGAQGASVLASAQYTVNLSNLVALLATFLQFSALILASYPMLKSPVFRRSSAYVGWVTGVLSLLFIPAFALGSQLAGLFNIAGFAFLVAWSILVGYRLRKLASSPQAT